MTATAAASPFHLELIIKLLHPRRRPNGRVCVAFSHSTAIFEWGRRYDVSVFPAPARFSHVTRTISQRIDPPDRPARPQVQRECHDNATTPRAARARYVKMG
jgi:hypothetical protein